MGEEETSRKEMVDNNLMGIYHVAELNQSFDRGKSLATQPANLWYFTGASHALKNLFSKKYWASLVVHWLRIRLPT